MPTLLVVEAGTRGEHSVSRGLTRLFVEQWMTAEVAEAAART